jgi:hypothetical protein
MSLFNTIVKIDCLEQEKSVKYEIIVVCYVERVIRQKENYDYHDFIVNKAKC